MGSINFDIDADEAQLKVIQFRNICDNLCELYEKKNHDYGNSFEESYAKLGHSYQLGRLLDKLNRLIALMGKEETIKCKDESIADTLKDLACYSIMTLNYLHTHDEH